MYLCMFTFRIEVESTPTRHACYHVRVIPVSELSMRAEIQQNPNVLSEFSTTFAFLVS